MIEELGLGGADGVRAVVTTRFGGVSAGAFTSLNLGGHVGDDPDAVRANRDRVATALGVPRLTIADQQHTATVAVVTADLVGRGHGSPADAAAAFPATDGLVTDVPGAALAVLVADCTPLVLWDPVHRAAGVAHCGRPGVIAGVVPAVVASMASAFGTSAADLVAGLGPGICRASYEVSDIEADAMQAVFPGRGLTEPTRPGHHLLDVPGGALAHLRDLGVPDRQVHVCGVDTRTHSDRFFSHRAQTQSDGGPTGRFAAVVVVPR